DRAARQAHLRLEPRRGSGARRALWLRGRRSARWAAARGAPVRRAGADTCRRRLPAGDRPAPVRARPRRRGRSGMKAVDQDIPGTKREYVGYGSRPPKVFWPNEAKAVVSLCINQEEGSEYSKPGGDERNEGLAEIPYTMSPEHRDLTAESIYEYGSRAG